MESVKIINQPVDGRVGDILIEALNSGDFDSLTLCVAFAKNSGVLRLKEAFEDFRAQGGRINAFVGIDLHGTSHEALLNLFEITDSLWITHIRSNQTFHPKVYDFRGSDSSVLVTGSSNFTKGGLWTNFETSTVISSPVCSGLNHDILRKLDRYYEALQAEETSLSWHVKTPSDIDRLHSLGLVEKELVTFMRRKGSAKERDGSEIDLIFPQNYYAYEPGPSTEERSVSENELEKPVDSSLQKTVENSPLINAFMDSGRESDELLWFETRKLTGGSRNQIDLSMKARVIAGTAVGTKYEYDGEVMQGGVVFFGVDPTSETTKEITINFEGVDYYPNKIHMPEGESSNGTWRLLLNGPNSEQLPFQRVMEQKYYKNYLTEKVLIFEKISEDYFGLTVLPDSLLNEIIEASVLVAKNGSGSGNAKKLGLLRQHIDLD